MKRNLNRAFLLGMLFMLIIGTIPVYAAEDAIPSINIDVVLHSDGSAVITEEWTIKGVYEGTEYYKGLYNMEEMSVNSLLVWDESATHYETLDKWDTSRSLEEKSGTCGILKTSDGYELCWGIGSYGDHVYTIEYTLEGFVKDYGDYAGFYYRFISELSSDPESVTVQLQMSDGTFTSDNARIWAYGFEGKAEIGSDGNLYAFTTSDTLDDSDYVNLLCQFDRSLFPTANVADKSFEELQETAENDNSDTLLYILLAILTVIIVVIVIVLAYASYRYKLADGTTVKLPSKKHIEHSGTIPFSGSVPAVFSALKLLRNGCSRENLMSAYLMRWKEKGYIDIQKMDDEEAIVFCVEKITEQGSEQMLYKALSRYADNSGTLFISQIEDHAEKLDKKLSDWENAINAEGERELVSSGLAGENKKGKIRFTQLGFDKAINMLGFHKYLKNMNEEYEKGSKELWGDYLVFATLFDLGEQVLENMQALDPEYYDDFLGMYGYNSFQMMYFLNMTSDISSATVQNIDGTGGDASASGGGGFSGSGGGGSR